MKCHTIKLVEMVNGRMVATLTLPECLEAFMEKRGFTPIGKRGLGLMPDGTRFREEIVGLPIYDELYGPMYDGEGIARYEDAESNKTLST